MEIDTPEVVAEVRAAFQRYDQRPAGAAGGVQTVLSKRAEVSKIRQAFATSRPDCCATCCNPCPSLQFDRRTRLPLTFLARPGFP